jgi:hypothetical protein
MSTEFCGCHFAEEPYGRDAIAGGPSAGIPVARVNPWPAASTSARVRVKQIQIKPSKSKQKSLDFLVLLWLNQVFSMSYEDSK